MLLKDLSVAMQGEVGQCLAERCPFLAHLGVIHFIASRPQASAQGTQKWQRPTYRDKGSHQLIAQQITSNYLCGLLCAVFLMNRMRGDSHHIFSHSSKSKNITHLVLHIPQWQQATLLPPLQYISPGVIKRLLERIKEYYTLQADHNHMHPAHAGDTPRHLHKHTMGLSQFTTEEKEAYC